MMSVQPAHPPAREPTFRHASAGSDIVIGLVNNMPDAALRGTERQYGTLLGAACRDLPIRLKLFTLPQVPRADAGRSHVSQHYESIDDLWEGDLDGLIVTGSQPRAPMLTDEPYWQSLTELVEWAERNTVSTMWSCLAAHAAVLYIDGIARRPYGDKLSGVFDCSKAAEHPIVAGVPYHWREPHSRYNGLCEQALAARDYRILARSPSAGVSIFTKQGKSLFVFLQGHPEYAPDTLFREYRRDVGRFLAGEVHRYPSMPRGYFDAAATAAFITFQQRALRNPSLDLLLQFPGVEGELSLRHSWRELATRIFANWVTYLAERKSRGVARSRIARVREDA
jgi:homoserine O-succinyltransferase